MRNIVRSHVAILIFGLFLAALLVFALGLRAVFSKVITLRADQSVVDVGEIRVGGVAPLNVRVTNVGSRRVAIIGAEGNCGCLSASDFPVFVDPSKTASVRFNVHAFKGPTGRFTRFLRLWTDLPDGEGPIIEVRMAVTKS